MREFFAYFFGVGSEIEFRNFTLAHFLPILVAAGIVVLIYYFRRRIVLDSKLDMGLRYFLAFVMILSEMSYYWRLAVLPELGGNVLEHLPITVCGWATVFASYMVLTKSQTLFDVVYFFVFAGTIFALITPTVISYTGPTRFRFYQFWAEHTLAYFGIFYMIFVHKMRPNLRSVAKAYISLAVLAVIAYITNVTLGPGANYLFMAEPESTPSILDILPPNFVLRLFIMILAVTALFALSYLPWFLIDRRARKAALATAEENTEAE